MQERDRVEIAPDSTEVERIKARGGLGLVRERIREYVQILVATFFIALFLKTFIVEAFRIPTASMEETLLPGDFLLVNKFVYGPFTPRQIPFTAIRLPHARLPALEDPKRGDVIVFEFPGMDEKPRPGEPVNYVKRCIGLPGDTIVIENRMVHVNGKTFLGPLEAKIDDEDVRPKHFRDYRIFPRGSNFNGDNYGPVLVPKAGDLIPLDVDNINQWRSLIEFEGHTIEARTDGTVRVDGETASTYQVHNNYYFVLGDNRGNSMDSRFWGFVPHETILGKVMLVYWSWDPEEAQGNFLERFEAIRWERIGKIVR